MYVELLSLLTAISFGLSSILTRWGMRDSNPITGAMVGSLVQVLALSVIIAVNPPVELNLMGVAYFIASGLFASTLGRLLNYISIQRLGVSMSSTIIGANPLFSTFFAAIFLAEEVTPPVFVGTVLVVGGVAITSLKDGNVRELLSTVILTPILAAAAYGASSVFRKLGVDLIPHAPFGALIGAATSLASFSIYLVATGQLGLFKLTPGSWKFFGLSGLAVTVAWLSMYSAFALGKVSVVSALIGTSPLFTLVLSRLFLRDTERLNTRIVLGCLSIVAGATVITLFEGQPFLTRLSRSSEASRASRTSTASFSFAGVSSVASVVSIAEIFFTRARSRDSSARPASAGASSPSGTMTTLLWQLAHQISPDLSWNRGELHSGQLLLSIVAPDLRSSAISFMLLSDRDATARYL